MPNFPLCDLTTHMSLAIIDPHGRVNILWQNSRSPRPYLPVQSCVFLVHQERVDERIFPHRSAHHLIAFLHIFCTLVQRQWQDWPFFCNIHTDVKPIQLLINHHKHKLTIQHKIIKFNMIDDSFCISNLPVTLFVITLATEAKNTSMVYVKYTTKTHSITEQ